MSIVLLLFAIVAAYLVLTLGINNFQRGDLCPVKFQPAGFGGTLTLNVTGHTLDRSCLLFDCTHTGLQGAGTGRIAGKSDSAGTVLMDFDADNPPYLNTHLTEGISGIMLFFESVTQPIQIPVILEKCHYEVAVPSQNKCAFDVKENVFVGVKVYPAF